MRTIESLPELLRARARENPDEPFLFFKDQAWSRRELDVVSDAIASELVFSHIRPGDRVALLLGNSSEFIVYYFGTLKAGAIAVPINNQLKEAEITYILKNSGASGLIVEPQHHDLAASFLSQCSDLKFAKKIEFQPREELLRLAHSQDKRAELLSLSPRGQDPANIIYTSGTTGFPKGAVLTHRNWLFVAQSFVSSIGMTDLDRVLCFLPLYHVNSQGVVLLPALWAGGSVVLMEKFALKEFFELLSRCRCTIFSSVPSIYTVLLSLPDPERYDLSSLRLCISGGASLPSEVLSQFEAKFKAHILEAYGLSESTCAATVNPPPPGQRKIGSIGIPCREQKVRVVGDDGRELGAGKVGELVISGDGVMQGYWNNPKASAEALQGGWLHTGDLAAQDEDGYLFIKGRKKEMIIRGGENVYPREIEEVLYQHPAIHEAAVVGLPDRRYGEEVAAFVVLREGLSCKAQELTKFLRGRIADYKIPRRIEFISSFPKTSTGKIQKLKLRERFLEGEKAST